MYTVDIKVDTQIVQIALLCARCLGELSVLAHTGIEVVLAAILVNTAALRGVKYCTGHYIRE